MTYEVYAAEKFLEEFSKYPSPIQDKINRKLSELRENPYIGTHWKTEVFGNKYKVDIGNLRIIYEIDKRNRRIYLVYLHKIFSPPVYRKIKMQFFILVLIQYILVSSIFLINNYLICGILIFCTLSLGIFTAYISHIWFVKGKLSPPLYDFSLLNIISILPTIIAIWLSLLIKVSSC